MDKLDPQKYIESQRAKQRAGEEHSAPGSEDSGDVKGFIGILVLLLSVVGFVVSYFLNSPDAPEYAPAEPRPEMATEFWGPESEPTPVDTPAGMFTEVFKFPISVDQGVSCHLAIEETHAHEDWSPTAAIALSELGRFGADVIGEQYVKITAVLQAAEFGRVYQLGTWQNEQQYSFPFLRIMEPADEIWLVLGSRTGGDFAYRASEESGEYGAGLYHRPSIQPRVATVIVSGAKGTIACEIIDI